MCVCVRGVGVVVLLFTPPPPPTLLLLLHVVHIFSIYQSVKLPSCLPARAERNVRLCVRHPCPAHHLPTPPASALLVAASLCYFGMRRQICICEETHTHTHCKCVCVCECAHSFISFEMSLSISHCRLQHAHAPPFGAPPQRGHIQFSNREEDDKTIAFDCLSYG